jgi:endonuclease/exonuclease/phosphatase family metal-dependent hydrolase
MHFSSLLVVLLTTLTMKAHAALPIRILTHNIRYAASPPSTGEAPWSTRKTLILNELEYHTRQNSTAFICLQEALHQQVVDIMAGLGDEWSYIGVGRDDGKKKGEYSPVIFRKNVWSVESWETVWLNENGQVGKKGWDAGSVRILTVGTFVHKESKSRVVGMSTHFDNAGTVARREEAKIVQRVVGEVTGIGAAQRLPFFLGGDLNSEPKGEAYGILNAATSLLRDAEELAEKKYGDKNTFTGFNGERQTKLDHVFVGPRGQENWKVQGYSVLPNRFEDGVYSSDHRAVVVDGVVSV